MADLESLWKSLPPALGKIIQESCCSLEHLEEIRLRLGQPIPVSYTHLNSAGTVWRNTGNRSEDCWGTVRDTKERCISVSYTHL